MIMNMKSQMVMTVIVLIAVMFESNLFCNAVVCFGTTASGTANGTTDDCGGIYNSCTDTGKCLAYANGTCYTLEKDNDCGEVGITNILPTTAAPTAAPTDAATESKTSSSKQSQLPFAASLLGLVFILNQL